MKSIVYIVMVMFFASICDADTIVLKNKEDLEGTIVSENPDHIMIRTTAGVIRLQKKEIASLKRTTQERILPRPTIEQAFDTIRFIKEKRESIAQVRADSARAMKKCIKRAEAYAHQQVNVDNQEQKLAEQKAVKDKEGIRVTSVLLEDAQLKEAQALYAAQDLFYQTITAHERLVQLIRELYLLSEKAQKERALIEYDKTLDPYLYQELENEYAVVETLFVDDIVPYEQEEGALKVMVRINERAEEMVTLDKEAPLLIVKNEEDSAETLAQLPLPSVRIERRGKVWEGKAAFLRSLSMGTYSAEHIPVLVGEKKEPEIRMPFSSLKDCFVQDYAEKKAFIVHRYNG